MTTVTPPLPVPGKPNPFYKWLKKRWKHEAMGTIGLIVALIAFMAAEVEAYNARKEIKIQSEKIDQSISRIEAIGQNLSTHPLPKFPENITPITNLIRGAKKSIKIACDYPGYGLWTKTSEFVNYEATIAQRRAQTGEPIKFRFVFNSPKIWQWIERFQFPNNDWSSYTKTTTFSEKSKTIKTNFGVDLPTDRQAYLETMRKLQLAQAKLLSPTNESLKYISELMPIHIWIADSETIGSIDSSARAIFFVPSFELPADAGFAIPNSSKSIEEIGFETTDPQLIQSLTTVFHAYEQRSMNTPEE